MEAWKKQIFDFAMSQRPSSPEDCRTWNVITDGYVKEGDLIWIEACKEYHGWYDVEPCDIDTPVKDFFVVIRKPNPLMALDESLNPYLPYFEMVA